jgi:hypothetical protein
MNNLWFVMLNSPHGPTPLLRQHIGRDEPDVALYKSEDIAEEEGGKNPLGRAYGWATYQWEFEVPHA